MKDWQEEQDVVVVYPDGTTRLGTIARCFTDRTYSVIFFEDEGEAEQADPRVPERFLREPGTFIDRNLPPERGCAE